MLNHVYVKDGYTDKSYAEKIFVPTELRKRGGIILVRSISGKLLGMAIFVPSTSPARQVAELGEAEIHLLAVYPEVRCQGIASHLIKACEEQAVSFGYSKMVLSTQQTMKETSVSTSNSITDEILHEIGQRVKARSTLFMKRSFRLS